MKSQTETLPPVRAGSTQPQRGSGLAVHLGVDLLKFCNEQNVSSELIAKAGWLYGHPIFPGRNLVSGVTVTIPKSEIDAAREQSAYKSLMPILIFCVTYRFPFDDKSHHTGLIFSLSRLDSASVGGSREFNATETLVPVNKLRLTPYPFRSGIAN
jgi:hypothetical protein